MDPLEDLNIRQIKLVNGDELIAFIQTVNKDGIVIEKPFKIITNIKPDGTIMHGFFTEWMSLGKHKSTYTIYPAHIISHEEVKDDVKESYIKYALSHDIDKSTDEDDGYDGLYDIDPPSNTRH